MRLSEVRAAVRNPKGHDDDGIRGSIERHGIAELPLIDERTGRLVAGHGRIKQLTAMSAAGQDPPDGVDVDPDSGEWLVPVTRGWSSRSDAEAEAYLVASNKLTMNGGWDDERQLTQILSGLADEGLLALTGFSEDELTDLLLHDGPEPMPEPGDADTDAPGDAWGVVVVCRDEHEQTDLLAKLAADGHTVRALMT
jgi:hypothetical protein